MIPKKPFLGSKPFAIVLCKFKGENAEPHSPDWFMQWITRGNGMVNDFFNDISYGKCNFDGSQVFGWYELPYTAQEDLKVDRYNRIVNAAKAVEDKVDFTPFYGICIVTNPGHDTGSVGGGIFNLYLNNVSKEYGILVLDEWGWQPSVACQEFAHALGMANHSRSANDPINDYGNPYDIMSALNCYAFTDNRFDLYSNYPNNNCGPGFNTPNLDLFGWLDPLAIFKIPTIVITRSPGKNKVVQETFVFDLAAINHPEASDYICAIIETNHPALGDFTYYFEYRTSDGWDAGILNGTRSKDVVLIQQQRSDEFNYLISPGPHVNALRKYSRYHDSDLDMTIKVLDFARNVATIEVTLPVRYIYFKQQPSAPIYHKPRIYYRHLLEENIMLMERSLQNMKEILKNEFDQFDV